MGEEDWREEDWREIVQLIRNELRGIGQDEIADLSNYEVRNGTERKPLDPRNLAIEMLNALQRDMVVRSSATVQESLDLLGQLIDEGECPTEAVVWVDQESSLIEGRSYRERLDGIQGAEQADKELEQLIGQLKEIRFGGDLQ